MNGSNAESSLSGFIHKLTRFASLDREDVSKLAALPVQIETVPRHRQLVREGVSPDRCCLLLAGFTCRYKETVSGARQVVSFHIPGDLLDIQHLLLAQADHSVEAITAARVGWIPKADLLRLAWERRAICEALWRDCLVDASIFREWVLNVGRRDAKSRIAHLLCEFAARCDAAGVGNKHRFDLPMTQPLLAEATGLTSVHVNRTLKRLDEDGALERNRNSFTIVDWDRLCAIGDFDPAYLHMAA